MTEAILDAVYHLMQKRNARIIGINGLDTSGKTEFSQCLTQFLTARGVENQILHIDDFHNPRAVRRNNDYYGYAYDLQTVEQKILRPFRNNGNWI